MRLISWNVNGLRAFLKRQKQLLPAALEAFGADIICCQEVKVCKAELDRTLAIAPGWDSFFCLNLGKTGYSGVVTFCRSSVTVPDRAEEGLTGVLQARSDFTADVLPEILERFPQDQLKELDAEGRCVITDHGAFVLFNLYGPAIASTENQEARFAFKLAFYEVLQLRVDALRRQDRNVVVVGDLNISPAPRDSCCSGSGEDLAAFKRRKDRVWLNSLLAPAGPWVDVFRRYHPDREEAFTCWNQASGARVNNYGSRIDLILAADACSSAACCPGVGAAICASDIEPAWQGSDHAPVWADLAPSCALSRAGQPPPLASRHLFTGKQQSMTAFLRSQPAAGKPKQATEPPVRAALQPSKPAAPAQARPTAASQPVGAKRKRGGVASQSSLRSFLSKPAGTTCTAGAAGIGQVQPQPQRAASAGTASRQGAGQAAAAGDPQSSGQASQAQAGSSTGATSAGTALEPQDQPPAELQEDAATAWKRIQQRMAPPKCFGHSEDCVIRQVKKGGANQGRLFYVCARADGPKPHGRCDHFVWVGTRGVRGK